MMNSNSGLELTTEQLKRIKVFAEMSAEQLAVFVGLVEVVTVQPNRLIVKQHEMGDCMYLLLEGEVRVSQTANNREAMLATLETGDFFGEVCLFDRGPRSADVTAVRDCVLLKITRPAFDTILKEHPDVAALWLLAILRTTAARLRRADRKYVDSITLARMWDSTAGAGAPPRRPAPPVH